MKLSKRGWGLVAFLIFIAIFIICLITSAIGFRKLGLLDENYHFVEFSQIKENRENMKKEKEEKKKQKEEAKKNEEKKAKETYSKLEEEMVKAAKSYVSKYYNNKLTGEASLFLKVSVLQNYKYLGEVKDSDGNACSGYVAVSKNDDETLSYTPYLKCKNYTAKGYEERKDD